MSTHPLPASPSLDHLRQQARALQRAVRAGGPGAVERVDRQHPGGVPADPTGFTLSAAQLVVAREYGFPSWPRLKRHVELVAGHGEEETPKADAPGEAAGPVGVADEFCRLACLTYTDEDDPDRWERAKQLLAAHPRLTGSHIWAAAAAADPGAVVRLVDEDPGRARSPGGPYGWRPLYYLAYSRAKPDVPADSVLTVARLLLEAGADPNEAYPHPEHRYPLTVLTGVFGEAGSGTDRQPAHPRWSALAELLLSFGADHNDRQVLRNRMSRPDNGYLELLHQYGLATVYRSERDPVDPAAQLSAELLREQLRYAVEHDFVDRVRLLVHYDIDYRSEYPDGHTPIELARLHGSDAVTDYLVSERVTPPVSDPALYLINAVLLFNDAVTVERLAAKYPDIVDRVGRTMPNLIARVASHGRTELISLLADIGFDVNSTEQVIISQFLVPGTALHEAARRGDLNLARVMLSLGTDPNIRDIFGQTALDQAREAGHSRMVALLAPLTADGSLAG